jgi:hypothetical protein
MKPHRILPPLALPLLCCLMGLAFETRPAGAAYLDDWHRMKHIEPRRYLCRHTAEPLRIDGRLDDAAWKSAPWTDRFVDIEGSAKPRPHFRTRAKMLWDDQYFYVAAELEDPHVWGTLTNHDAVIFHDPDFEVFIDPDGDSHDYYEFEMNALNTGWDLRLPKPYKDGGPALNEWEIPGLKTAVHVRGTLNNPADRDEGWTLEIAFPWKALGEFTRAAAPPREGDQWRVSFSRVQWLFEIVDGGYRKIPGKKEDNWVWSPQGIIDMHRPEKWGYVEFTRASRKWFRSKPRTDPSAAARSVLQEIYYAQKDFYKVHKRWASRLAELKLSPGLGLKLDAPPSLQLTAEGYQATVGLRLADGRRQSWHIRQDAKVWSE